MTCIAGLDCVFGFGVVFLARAGIAATSVVENWFPWFVNQCVSLFE